MAEPAAVVLRRWVAHKGWTYAQQVRVLLFYIEYIDHAQHLDEYLAYLEANEHKGKGRGSWIRKDSKP